ncbi:hypothetical protein ACHAPV_004849 [Trichoderma viride]
MIKQNNPDEEAKLEPPPGLQRLFMAFLISNLTTLQGYNTKILTKSLRNPEVGDNPASNNPESRARCSDLTLMRLQFVKVLPRDRSSLRVATQ